MSFALKVPESSAVLDELSRALRFDKGAMLRNVARARREWRRRHRRGAAPQGAACNLCLIPAYTGRTLAGTSDTQFAMQRPDSNSFERAFVILELVSRSSRGFTNADVSRRLNIATSSSSYILTRMEKFGYLRRDENTGRYRIGLKVLSLAHGVLRNIGLREAAEPILYRLAIETRLSSLVAVLEQGCALLIERVEGPELALQKLDIDVGVRMPIHATAVGKILLAYLPEVERLKLIRQRGLRRFSPRTQISEESLLRELEIARRQGYAVNEEENFVGFRAIAAPILDSCGELRAGISAAGRTSNATWDGLDSVTSAVRAAAREISKRAYH
jgi:IclR family transcriptional regulator, KDG regulon repressor